MSKFIKRSLTSIIYFMLVMSVVLLESYTYALLIVGIEACLAIYEYFNVVEVDNKIYKYIGYFLVLLYTLSGLVFETTQIYAKEIIILGFMLSGIIAIIKYEKTNINELTISNFGYLYIPFMLSFIPELFTLKNGHALYMILMFAVMMTDSGAYLIGTKFGKHKLTKLSPNKTIEGSVGGVITALVTIGIIYIIGIKTLRIDGSQFNIYTVLLITFVISVLSQFGDLLASYIKRAFNKKDYGNILLGHGGILDRIDSLIFVAPIAFILFKYILI